MPLPFLENLDAPNSTSKGEKSGHRRLTIIQVKNILFNKSFALKESVIATPVRHEYQSKKRIEGEFENTRKEIDTRPLIALRKKCK